MQSWNLCSSVPDCLFKNWQIFINTQAYLMQPVNIHNLLKTKKTKQKTIIYKISFSDKFENCVMNSLLVRRKLLLLRYTPWRRGSAGSCWLRQNASKLWYRSTDFWTSRNTVSERRLLTWSMVSSLLYRIKIKLQCTKLNYWLD